MSFLIDKKDLFNPIKELWTLIGCKNIEIYDEINKILKENKLINTYNPFIDNACFHSINYYMNINLCAFINLTKRESYQYYVHHFKETHSLYGIKTLKVPFDYVHKILYQIQYQDITNYYDLLKAIHNDYPFLDKYNNEDEIEINILLLVNKKETNIILNNSDTFICLYSNIPTKKKVMSSIFYNEKSLKFIEMQNLKKVLSTDFEENVDEFKELMRKIINYDYITQENMMLNSSIILMLMGMRKNNDIDMYIHKVENPESISDNLREIRKLDFVIKDTKYMPSHWNTWLDEWAQKCGANYFEEIVGFNNYHFYFCGIKFMWLNVDIQRRITRARPASIADLIMLNKVYFMNIKLPKIPNTFFEYKKVEILSEEEKTKLLENGAIYDENNREYKLEKKTNMTIFNNKVKEYLKTRYQCDINIDEIKKFLNVSKKIKIKIKIKK